MSNVLTVGGIFALAIGVYFLSALVPGAISSLTNINTTGWDPAVVTLFGLIPLAIVAGIVLIFIPRTGAD